MAKKYLWDIVYTEKYTNKEWMEKKKYTTTGALFLNEENWYYSINFLWQWLNVFSKDNKDTKPKKNEFWDDIISVEDVPF